MTARQEKQAVKRLTDEAIAELLKPEPEAPLPVVEPPPPVKIPSPTKESIEARFQVPPELIRKEGAADPPRWSAPAQKLTLTERGGREHVFTFDPEHGGAYVSFAFQRPDPSQPWLLIDDQVRMGVSGLASITLEDLNDNDTKEPA